MSMRFGGLVVSDDEVREAMRTAYHHFKIVVEPGGAAALACVLSGKIDIKGKAICVVATGGNVDVGLFQSVLNN